MKQIFTLSIALFLSLSLLAFNGQSLLTISSNTNYAVRVNVDNRNVYQQGSNDNDIVLKDVRAGYHSIKIFRNKITRFDNDKRYSSNNQQILYSGNVYVKQGFHVDVTINRFGKVFIDEKKIGAGDYDGDSDDWNQDDQYSKAMNANDFNQLKQAISNGNFDNTKQSIAKQGISSNYFSAAQVKELVGLFSFETSKLEIAKYAYGYCIDQQNYFVVSNTLGYSNSKEELAAFIGRN